MLFLLLLPIVLVTLLYKVCYKLIKRTADLRGRHVCITGGSSGIGKSVAILAAKQGAHVTIIARNRDRLSKTLSEIESVRINPHQVFKSVSQDCADKSAITKAIEQIDDDIPIFMLVNCAGMAIAAKCEDASAEDVKMLFDANYFGVLYPIQALLHRIKSRKEGSIVLTGSQGSLCGVYGYSIYASTKYALRGLAECLHMELLHENVSVTIALPPDTDTPGFETENKTKPIETRLISEAGGLFKPDEVAEKLLKDALDKKFYSTIGFESFILTSLCGGMTHCTHLFDLLFQAMTMGVFRLILACYLKKFHEIIAKCKAEKQAAQKKST